MGLNQQRCRLEQLNSGKTEMPYSRSYLSETVPTAPVNPQSWI